MSSVSKVLKKRKQKEAQQTEQTKQQEQSPVSNQNDRQVHTNRNEGQQHKNLYDENKQKTFQNYVDYKQYNPSCFQFSNEYMPNSTSLYNRYKAPLSCFFSPVNQDLEYVERSGDKIPKCGSCRAYMNYYNEVDKRRYKCFLCGRDNNLQGQYNPSQSLIELTQPNYLVDGPSNIYNSVPPQNTYIFLVDVSHSAFQSKMLSYMVSVIKDVLAREELDDTQIHFFTYDDTIHEYDFSAGEVERTVFDPSVKNLNPKNADSPLKEIREKFFQFLDSLEEVAQKNTKNTSSFFTTLEYVYDSVKHTGGKIFIFQANDALAGQPFTSEVVKNANQVELQKIKSLLETKNKQFFNRFVQPMLVDNISMAFFIFGRSYKNIRVFSDTCKLTNSQLLYYSADIPQDLTKFYYEFYHLLSANYYIDLRMQMIISSGWYFTAVYGNLYRLKQYISFKFCHYQPSKRVCAVFMPQEGFNAIPYFSFQLITHYIYGRKHYMSINTNVMPLTSSLDRLFQNIHIQIAAASIFKIYMSSMRLDQLVSCKNKYIKQVATIWKAINDFYRGKFPPEIRNLFLSYLAYLKNYHSQIDLIDGSLILQKIISQRNILQSCSYLDINSVFSPYLFKIDNMTKNMCQDQNFIYPEVCQLKFSSIKEGVYLLDAGFVLYLYFSKTYNPQVCFGLLGKQKISKTENFGEDHISNQGTFISQQVLTLIRVLRESKTYGWIPLHIVRCGENTIYEKNFYLNFYEQKYDEFKSHRLAYDQFIGMLSKQY